MSWYLAKSLVQLKAEIDALAPDRNTSTDGDIGDKAHQSRKSDHNPSNGVVKALDITHDPAHGVDGAYITEQMRLSRDKRIKYVIYNRRIFGDEGNSGSAQPWEWHSYDKDNPHTAHFHVSVDGNFDDSGAWGIKLATPGGQVIPFRKLQFGDEGDDVKKLQTLLGVNPDGIFGSETEAAVKLFQAEHKIEVDGIVGGYTWEALTPSTKVNEPARVFSNIKATVFNDATLAYGPVPPTTIGASLPWKFKSPPDLWIRNRANGLTVVAHTIDVGPWNTDDAYWETGTRPQAESGVDRSGRRTNKAGLDLYPETARRLGIEATIVNGSVVAGEGQVDWGFADELPTPVPVPVPTPTPVPVPEPVPEIENAELETAVRGLIAEMEPVVRKFIKVAMKAELQAIIDRLEKMK